MSDAVKAMEAELNHRASRRAAADADWNESKHKRAPDGKFGSGSGGGSAKTESGEKKDAGEGFTTVPIPANGTIDFKGQNILPPSFTVKKAQNGNLQLFKGDKLHSVHGTKDALKRAAWSSALLFKK